MTVFETSIAQKWFDSIFALDVSPAIFNVTVERSSASEGYQAILSFRRPHVVGALDYISCRGNTPEEVLHALYNTLKANFGKCELCGNYRTSQDDNL